MKTAHFRFLARSIAPFLGALASLAAAGALSGCAVVHQMDREYLSDPIMQRVPDPMATGLESHNLPRREGAAGGNAASGGGCGC